VTELAPGLASLDGFPRWAINVYLVGDVLIDAGTRCDRGRIFRQLAGRPVAAHALTHAHPDHQGSSAAVCRRLGIPLWCGAADADAAEDPGLIVDRLPTHAINRAIAPRWMGPGHPVARRLREGDDLGAGFVVVETPGHSAGHVSFWRASDRTLVLGDLLANIDWLTWRPGLREPPQLFTPDPAANRRAARRVAELHPALVVFGHGPPLRNDGRFERFVAGLAAD